VSATLFVLDIDDFRPLALCAARAPGVRVRRRGPYLTITTDGELNIDRGDTGCRNAVWYSAVAAVDGGRVVQWDRHRLRVQSDLSAAGPSRAAVGRDATDDPPLAHDVT